MRGCEMTERRVIICGGRYYKDEDFMRQVLTELGSEGTVIVHGGAAGADEMAGRLGLALGFDIEVHPAEWNKFGKTAGFVRNQEMADAGADLCIKFPGGRGTDHMVVVAMKAGIRVQVVR